MIKFLLFIAALFLVYRETGMWTVILVSALAVWFLNSTTGERLP